MPPFAANNSKIDALISPLIHRATVSGGNSFTFANGATMSWGAPVSADNEGANIEIPFPAFSAGDHLHIYGDCNYDLRTLNTGFSQVFGLGSPTQHHRRIADGTALDQAFLTAGVNRVCAAQGFVLSGAIGAFAGWTGAASTGATGTNLAFLNYNVFPAALGKICLHVSSREATKTTPQDLPGNIDNWDFASAFSVAGSNGGGGNDLSLLIMLAAKYSPLGVDIPAGNWLGGEAIASISGFGRAFQSPNV